MLGVKKPDEELTIDDRARLPRTLGVYIPEFPAAHDERTYIKETQLQRYCTS
jgi:hypothetical protein